MDNFVAPGSIVRRIWGNADMVLFIFAGAAAEFALNKSVDWLYFTGRLPKDPLGRMFSTVTYAHGIIFMEQQEALRTIDTISGIHRSVEEQRGGQIPDWAYRDVLFLLIHYSVSAFEMLERTLTMAEKEEVFRVFCRVGERMKLKDLPDDYQGWLLARAEHLRNNIECSHFSTDLFIQYKKQLKPIRYWIMRQVQAFTAPVKVQQLLLLKQNKSFPLIIWFYRLARGAAFQQKVLPLLLPGVYRERIRSLSRH